MLELALRTTVILAIAWIAAKVLMRAAAATRHRVWHGAVIAVLLAPVMSPWMPAITVPTGSSITLLRVMAIELPGVADSPGGPAASTPIAPPRNAMTATYTWSSADLSWATWLQDRAPSVWLLGSTLIALWFLAGWLAAAAGARRAARAPAAWVEQAGELRHVLDIPRPVAVKVLPQNTSPLVVGLWRSTILLPPAARAWSEERRHAVLLHELAHVRRGDCRVQACAQLACALYWFNPLVWMAAAALRRERERACDDEVLRRGAKPSAYAAHLLDIARDLSLRVRPTAALAMARPRELEGRLLAVLADGHPRGAGRASAWLVCMLIVGTTVVALGAAPGGIRPESNPPGPRVRPLSPTAFDGHSPATRDDGRRTRSEAASTLVTADDPEERSRAALSLAASGALDTIPSLARALHDESSDVREKAALALGLQSSATVVPHLVTALSDTSSQVREKAALGLALRRDPRSVDALIVAAADSDAQVREKVAMALGTSGDPRAADALQRLLADADPQVREKAAVALTLSTSLDPGDEAGERARQTLRTLVSGVLALVQ